MRSKWTVGAGETVGRFRFDVAVRLLNARAQMFEAGEVQIDGPRADGAAAGQRDARAAAARHQRTQHQARSAHGLHQFVRRFRRDDIRRVQAHGFALHLHLGADIHQQPLHGADVAHARNAAQQSPVRRSAAPPPAPAAPSSSIRWWESRPAERAPPLITNLSMESFRDPSAGLRQPIVRLFAVHAELAHHDRGAYAVAGRRQQARPPPRT